MIPVDDSEAPLVFRCYLRTENSEQSWNGRIRSLRDYGSHQEIVLSSRSAVTLIVGAYTHGHFLSVPEYGIGCDLAQYDDVFWNRERLSRLLSLVDAVTIAEALRFLDQQGLLENT